MLYFLAEIVQKPKFDSAGVEIDFFRLQFSIKKILQFLHFTDNSNYDATDPGRDILFKVRDIVEFLVDRFKTVYIPLRAFQ